MDNIVDVNIIDTYTNYSSEKISKLYKYFLNEGKIWRIDLEHIQAALRRNNGDIILARYDIQNLINNISIDIQTYFYIDKYGNETIISKGLPGQEWQENLIEGTFIEYNDELYKLVYIHRDKVSLEKILGYHDYDDKYINIITDNEVRIGKYKKISYHQIRPILEKEFEKITKEYNDRKYKKDIYMQKLTEYMNKCISNIHKIKMKCYNECSHEKKKEVLKDVLDTVYDDNLETEMFLNMIADFGLKTECNHLHYIEENEEELECIDSIIEDIINHKKFNETEYIYQRANTILLSYIHNFENITNLF